MALIDQYNLATNTEFQGKVLIAACKKARTVLAETATGDQANKRQALAAVVMQNPEIVRQRFATIVASNPSIDPTQDNDIEWTVGDAWDDIAGVKASEKS